MCSREHLKFSYPGTAFYHVMSRVVDGQYIFGDKEKTKFR